MNRVVDESYQKEILADMASRGEDVSEFYNSNGSMKTLQQSLEEDLAKASKDYDENINLHEDPLIHDDYIKKVHDENYQNSIIRDQKTEEYLAKEKAEFIKTDKNLLEAKTKEKNTLSDHLKNEKSAIEKDFQTDYANYEAGKDYNKTYEPQYKAIKDAKDAKEKIPHKKKFFHLC